MYSTTEIIRTINLIALTLVCFGLSPQARAVCQEGCLTNGNTVLGADALNNDLGFENTAVGFNALFRNNGTEGNTAIGWEALASNSTGGFNTAVGWAALVSNTTGGGNTAIGVTALDFNTTGSGNTATGVSALALNTTGSSNTAIGHYALISNNDGNQNTATGVDALNANKTGNDNTAIGFNALVNNRKGSNNIALGSSAGSALTTGDNNIDIGNAGFAREANHIRIGTLETHKHTFIAGVSGSTVAGGVAVIIDTDGHLGTITSSVRYKDEIKPMDKASEAILALQPVTFLYKHELDPEGIRQFGLVAEQVEKVDPDLVARDEQGKPYTVRYEAVNAMLLNEFLKEHRKVEEQATKSQDQAATITELKSAVAQQQLANAEQQKEIAALIANLKAQAAQIQKVSDQLDVQAPAPRVVAND
jgi:uncharacterized coiled-coil protein SlyX